VKEIIGNFLELGAYKRYESQTKRKEIRMRHSKVLEKKAKQDERIWKYYWEDDSHWIVLEDGYEFDCGTETTGEPNVQYALDKISRITKAERKS
jgi:hypothetical protein